MTLLVPNSTPSSPQRAPPWRSTRLDRVILTRRSSLSRICRRGTHDRSSGLYPSQSTRNCQPRPSVEHPVHLEGAHESRSELLGLWSGRSFNDSHTFCPGWLDGDNVLVRLPLHLEGRPASTRSCSGKAAHKIIKGEGAEMSMRAHRPRTGQGCPLNKPIK